MRQLRNVINLAMFGVMTMMALFILTSCSGGGGGGGSTASLQSITITPANPIIASGANQQYTAMGTYSDSTTKNITSSVSWSSSNTGIAAITNAGLATTIAVGSTTVTATSGSVSGNTTLTISNVGAVLQKTGPFGALMVGKGGDVLLPIVDRDASGNATKISGALYLNKVTGNNAVVYLGTDGKPTKTVMGDYILLFSNWSADSTTVDIAKIYTLTNYIEVYRGVRVNAKIAAKITNLKVLSKPCFPNCGSDTKNLAELARVGGVGISIGLCGVATTVSLGVAAIPCTGLLVGAASFLAGDEAWLSVQSLDAGFLAMDGVACLGGNAVSCLSALLNVGAQVGDIYSKELDDNNGSIANANLFLSDPNQPSGIVQQAGGLPTVPSGEYACTPGGSMHYLPCIPEGVRECQSDYTWGSCKPSGVCSSFTYSQWSACQPDNTQSKTIISRSPDGCTGGTPEALSQACTYTPQTCTYTYSDWSACQSNNTQTRTYTKSPNGCTGTPAQEEVLRSCTYNPGVTGTWSGAINNPNLGNFGCSGGTEYISISLNEDTYNITGSLGPNVTFSGSRTGNMMSINESSTRWGNYGPYTWTWDGANAITGSIAYFCWSLDTNTLLGVGAGTFSVTR